MKVTTLLLTALLSGAHAVCAAPVGRDAFFLSYFKDNGQAGVYLAMSEDGRSFTDLNGGKPIFAPPVWAGQNLTRDPSIVFHDGKFHMTWTTNWQGRVFGYATSPDLKSWSEPVKVEPFAASLPADEQPENVWAPEIHWDPSQKNFLILWSSTTPRQKRETKGAHNLNHRVYASRTADGKTFSPAQLFFNPGHNVIDGFLVFDEKRTVLAFKHENFPQDGGKNLRIAIGPEKIGALPVPFAKDSGPVAGPGSKIRPQEKAEGPTLLKIYGEWLLYWDAFENKHYSLAVSKDLTTWTDLTDTLKFPQGARHGTVFLGPRDAVAFTKP